MTYVRLFNLSNCYNFECNEQFQDHLSVSEWKLIILYLLFGNNKYAVDVVTFLSMYKKCLV